MKNFYKNMGLVLGGKYAMMYGYEHGALRWAPQWVKKGICAAWNHVACAFRGHDLVGLELYKANVVAGPPKCVHCLAEFKVDGRYLTPEEIKAHDELVYTKYHDEFNSHRHEEIANRAYLLWLSAGGYASGKTSLDFWFKAEAEYEDITKYEEG